MTHQQFIDKAVRAYELSLRLPRGWWGTWNHFHAPGGYSIRFAPGQIWNVRRRYKNGYISALESTWSTKAVSKHDSRAAAIKAVKRLLKLGPPALRPRKR